MGPLVDDPLPEREYWWDSKREGFGLRVSPNLKRSGYVYRYRKGGKQRVLTLGRFESLDDAVSEYNLAVGEVEKARRAIGSGKKISDPIELRRENREKHKELTSSAPLKDVVAEFFDDRKRDAERRARGKGAASKGLKGSTAGQYKTMFDKDLLRVLGKYPIGTIDEKDLKRACARVARTAPATAAGLLAATSGLFTWAMRKGIVGANPARLLSTDDYYTAGERDRTLDDSEIRAVFKIAGARPSTVWLGLLLTLATGARSGELLQLRFSDRDGDSLVIPAAVSKTKAQHRVPLSPLAREIVDELRVRAGKSEWLFPGKGAKVPMRQHTLGTMLRRAHQSGKGKLTVEFRPHDLRRTCRTKLSELGVSEHIGELILGHELRSKVERVYAHHAFEQEKRNALDKWSARLCELRGRPARCQTSSHYRGRKPREIGTSLGAGHVLDVG